MNQPLWDEMDVVEDALRSWPRAQTPRGFSGRVLRRIEKTPHAATKFRLTWLDVALGLFTASIPPVLLFIWNSLPLTVMLRLQFKLSVLQNTPGTQETLFLAMLGAAALLALLALAIFLFTFPTSQTKNPG
jgi:hypothetical protein